MTVRVERDVTEQGRAAYQAGRPVRWAGGPALRISVQPADTERATSAVRRLRDRVRRVEDRTGWELRDRRGAPDPDQSLPARVEVRFAAGEFHVRADYDGSFGAATLTTILDIVREEFARAGVDAGVSALDPGRRALHLQRLGD
jgi:hypothetical protein